MLPAQEIELIEDFTITTQPGLTWRLDLEQKRMSPGMVDGIEAVEQAIYKILLTERYQYPIYSWDYGIELLDLYGKPLSYVRPELERRIREALLQDDRITAVDSFYFESVADKNSLQVTFTAHTIYGDTNLTGMVRV